MAELIPSPTGSGLLVPDDGPTAAMYRSWDDDGDLLDGTIFSAQHNRRTFTKPYKQSEWVFAAVKSVATNLASLPVVVNSGPEQEPTPVLKGPLVDLFQTPMAGKPRECFYESIATWLMLKGEAFILPASKGNLHHRPTMPDFFRIAAPPNVRMVQKGRAPFQWGVKFRVGTHTTPEIPVTQDEVIHPYSFNPDDDDRGLAPLDLALLVGSQGFHGNVFNAAFLENGAFNGGWLEMDTAAGKDTRKRLRESFREQNRGAHKAGTWGLLPKGVTAKEQRMSHKEMQFEQLMKWSRESILAIFGVPKSMLSITDDLNFATALSQERIFWTRTIIPLAKFVASWFNVWLRRWLKEDQWIKFDSSGVEALQANIGEKMTVAMSLRKLGYTTNEINAHLNLTLPTDGTAWWRDRAYGTPSEVLIDEKKPATEDTVGVGEEENAVTIGSGVQVSNTLLAIAEKVVKGEIPPESAVGIIASAFPQMGPEEITAVIAPAAKAAEEKANEPDPEEEEDDTEEEGSEDEEEEGRIGTVLTRTFTTPRQRLDFSDDYLRALTFPREKATLRPSLELVRMQKRDARALVQALSTRDVGDLHTRDIDLLTRDLTKTDEKRIRAMRRKWDLEIDRLFSESFWTTMQDSSKRISKENGFDWTFDREHPRLLESHAGRIAEMLQADDKTARKVRSAIIRSVADGETREELVARISRLFKGNVARAHTIARTEVGSLTNPTRVLVMQENGIGNIGWATAGDEHVRGNKASDQANHVVLDGNEVPIGETFDNGLRYPHDPDNGEAKDKVNCRCTTFAVL